MIVTANIPDSCHGKMVQMVIMPKGSDGCHGKLFRWLSWQYVQMVVIAKCSHGCHGEMFIGACYDKRVVLGFHNKKWFLMIITIERSLCLLQDIFSHWSSTRICNGKIYKGYVPPCWQRYIFNILANLWTEGLQHVISEEEDKDE